MTFRPELEISQNWPYYSKEVSQPTETALTETVTVIVYATYSSDIIIEEGHVYHTTF